MKRFRRIVKLVGFFNAFKVIAGAFLLNTYNRFFRNSVNEFNTLSDIDRNYKYQFAENDSLVQVATGPYEIFCRRYSSDLSVFDQIFLRDDLKYLVDILKKGKFGKINTVIDAGANIGLFTLRLNMEFPGSSFVVIEPDKNNFLILKKNLVQNKINSQFENTGIWTESCRLYFDRSFRDKKEWSVSLTEEPISNDFVEALSLNDIITRHSLTRVDLLKIDIEGGERFIFNADKKGLEFLEITKVLVIEIHDEFKIRQFIIDLLSEKGFTTNNSGEYLLAFNTQLN
ncbi:MAG: FkbM family methyltransferase [Bacteroidota bacterium]